MDDAANPIETIFNEALRQPNAEQRAAYLARACGNDARLRARVESLLKSHDDAGSFMASSDDSSAAQTLDGLPAVDPSPFRRPAGAALLADSLTERAGTIIGHYKLLQQIGQGGFGTVWMADQERPVRRRVALKIIKAGMDTKEVIARFEQERQALAMMDHPNIARVLDAGATATGRPYFVMELVRGVKITEYCDEQGLSTTERIELFITVCHAVQHAHQKGIIHRDLKPSNILVTINDGEAVPKVIDFGVAKATQGRLTDGTLFTQFEQMIGTPLYMSPEQAEITSLDVDTRSDIYALGVLLYELLTGRTPIDTATMARAGMDEVRRLIREVDPPRPSARLKTLAGVELTTMAKRRHTEPTKLPSALRGDIDWIVMKCLEKDRKRRYDTANGLAMDLQRHLHNDVVVARPPTTAYLLSKLVRRNKVACVAGAAIAASLVIGIAASVWQAVRATVAEKRAIATFNELRASAPAFAEQARALASRERFDEAIEKLDYAIKLRPDVAEYLVGKGDLLQCQMKLAEAAAMYRQALRAKPGLVRAEASAKLCDEVLAAPTNADGKLTRESLAKLYAAMLQQQRPAAELMPVARLLGEEKKLIVDYWLARLKDLPVSAEKPLKERLSVRDDGRLALDLSDTRVIDLTPLAGAPLAVLNVSSSKERSKLKDLSPLRGMDLIELNVSGTDVSDVSPLREMHSLEKLEMTATKVADLGALSGLRLTSLNFAVCPVGDLTPIRKMPLEEINLRQTRVADLSPLVGMPIKSIDLTMAPVVDFSPLAQLPLEKCYLQRNRITDLSIFRGMPLKELVLWACVDARNYAALTEIKTLELLLLPSEYRDLPQEDYRAIGALRGHPKLRQLGSEIMSQMGYAATGPKDVFWQDWDREQTFVPALSKSGIHFSLQKQATGGYHLAVHGQPLRDLSVLKGAPIVKLDLDSCPFSDLTPIHDLKLEALGLFNDWVTDLSPLQGMPLKTLTLYGNKIVDLAPLKGLPLQNLYLEHCVNVTDLSPLAEMGTLEQLTVPIEAGNIEALRKLTNLRMLAFNQSGVGVPASTADEFWKDYTWISRWRKAGLTLKGLKRLDDGTWEVDLRESTISDLSILRGASISTLYVDNTAVADLEPLRGMSLKKLMLNGTKVADLSPLKGMPLEELWISDTKVTDLSPLRGMPLAILRLHKCAELSDLSPLADCKALRSLSLPPGAKNFEVLRALPKLDHVSLTEETQYGYDANKTAKTFWHEVGQGWATALRNAGIRYTATKFIPAADAKQTAAAERDAETWSVTVTSKEFKDCTLFRGADSVRVLHLDGTAVSDLEPLRGLPLTKLGLGGTKVIDLAPLRGMSLEDLWLNGTEVADLSALRGMPINAIDIGNSRVADLEPLRGMPLKDIRAFNAPIVDLSPLEGMPLEHLHLSGTKIKDVSALGGMPLTFLRFHSCTELSDLAPLADCKALVELTLPPNVKDVEFFRALPRLERIGYAEDSQWHVDKTAPAFWKEYDEQGWVRALRATGIVVKYARKLTDGTWNVDVSLSSVRDLTMLKGVPISVLNLGDTAVSDLTPLRGMPLKTLRLFRTKVTDLSPLKGATIRELFLSGTSISDISAVRGMPLTDLKLDWCPSLTDLSPLADCKELKQLTLPPNAKDIEFLRTLANVDRISFADDPKEGYRPSKTAAAFWKEYDGQAWLRTLRAAGVAIKSAKQLPDGTWDLDLSDAKLRDLTPLKGAPISSLSLSKTAVTDLAPLHGMAIKTLKLDGTPVVDLGPLQGMPIEELNITGTRVADLAPLRGSSLTTLNAGNTPVTNLEPLRGLKLKNLQVYNDKVTRLDPIEGMPLAYLNLAGTGVSDLSAVRGMPLTSLALHNCKALTDVSPLADAKELARLTLPPGAIDYAFLRGLPKLALLSFTETATGERRPDATAADFWKADEGRKAPSDK